MSKISTHVLDLALGVPAASVPVRLERRDLSGEWLRLSNAQTDKDGRCAQLLPAGDVLRPGLYRLVFDTGSYHQAHERESFHPVVEITFRVREGDSSFHIPLLLSPFGYTTYRGS